MTEVASLRPVSPELHFAQRNALPIILKDGKQLKNITPRLFFTQSRSGDRPKSLDLMLLYTDAENDTRSVNMNQISGIEVMEHDGQLYIKATYYNPKENKLEDKPRTLWVKRISYGIHPNHAKVHEKPDFYVVADDKKYLDEGKTGTDAERSFPFWRLGIYGDLQGARKTFQPDGL